MGFLILDSFYLFTEFTLKFFKFTHKGTSLAVHWLGLHTSNAGDARLILGLRFHILQGQINE